MKISIGIQLYNKIGDKMKKILCILPLLFILFGCNFETATEVERDKSIVTIDMFEVNLVDSVRVDTDIYTYTITINIKNISEETQNVVVDDFKYSFNDDVECEIDVDDIDSNQSAIVIFTLTATKEDKINLGSLFFDINTIPMIVYLEDYK